MRFTQHFDQFFVWVDHLTIISRNYLEFEIIILFIPFLCQQIISRKGKSEESKIIKKGNSTGLVECLIYHKKVVLLLILQAYV